MRNMEEFEDGWNSTDSSEDEKDIEIALYSQIHFDPVPEDAGYENDNSENQQFCVGVEEVSLPLITSFKEKTPLAGESRKHYRKGTKGSSKQKHKAMDAIYITSSDEDDFVEIVPSSTKAVEEMSLIEVDEIHDFDMSNSKNIRRKRSIENHSLTASSEPQFNSGTLKAHCLNTSDVEIASDAKSIHSDSMEDFDKGDVLIFNTYPPENDSFLQNKSSENIFSISNERTSPPLVPENEKKNTHADEKMHKKISSRVSMLACKTKTSKKSSVALPFSVTKAPSNPEKEFSSNDSNSMGEEEETEKTHLMVPNLAQTNLKQNFLKFSKTCQKEGSNQIKLKKKKKLSKQEAAVKPRAPPVYIRRPPVVKVSYQQDSDTNTDYSDSDKSCLSTPTKKPTNKVDASKSKIVQDCDRGSLQDESSSSSSSSSSSTSDESDTECIDPKSVSSNKVKVKVTSIETKEKYSKTKRVTEHTNSDIENKSPTTEESDSDSSISSHGAELEKDAPRDPALDFNLEGGVDALLKRKSVDDASERWQISDKDRYQIPVTTNRYFNPFSFTCRNCNEEGHKAVDCPKPKKSLCIYCGRIGHVYQACPDSVCHNCSAPGHRMNECVEKRRYRRSMCDRCWMPGHFEEDCPDQWRQYHLSCESTKGKIQTAAKKESNPKVYCYNCGKDGHLGFECKGSRMNTYIVPNYPFIAKYKKCRHKEEKSRKEVKEKKEKSKTVTYKSKTYENSRGHLKKHQKKEKKTTSKQKDKGHKSKSPKAKDGFHKESTKKRTKSSVHKSERNNKSETFEIDGSQKNIRGSPEDDREKIVTNTTVFSFENTTTNYDYPYYAEENYNPPKKKNRRGRDHETAWRPEHRSHQPHFNEHNSKQSHHQQHYDDFENPDFIEHSTRRSHHQQHYDNVENPYFEEHSTRRRHHQQHYDSIEKPHFKERSNRRSQHQQHYDSAENRHFKENSTRQTHQQQFFDNMEDEMMHHQVYDNEWWREDSQSAEKKKRKKKERNEKTVLTPPHQSNHAGAEGSHYEHGVHQSINSRGNTSHQEIQNIHLTIHTSHYSDMRSTEDLVNSRRFQRRKEFFKSLNPGPRRKKSGFQMDAKFQSLSKSYKKRR